MDALEPFLQQALESINDGIYLATEDASIIYVNNSATRQLQYTKEELLEMKVFNVDPNTDENIWQQVMSKLQTKKTMEIETTHRRKDGSIFPVEVSINFIDYNATTYLLGIARDISERKILEKSLNDERSQLNEAQRIAKLGSWKWNVITGQLQWSDELYNMYGLDTGSVEPSYELYVSMVHPEDREYFQSWTKKVMEGTSPYEIEYRLQLDDGTSKYIRERGESVSNSDGSILYLVGTVEDISDYVITQNALDIRQKRFDALLSSTLDGYWMIDAKGIFLQVNDAYCQMSGYSKEELIGQPISLIEAEHKQEEIVAVIERIKHVGHLLFETTHRRKNGQIWEAQISVSYSDIEEGRLFVLVRDITEQKRLSEKLIQSDARFAAILNTTTDGYIIVKQNGVLAETNQAYADMLGYTVDELLRLRISEIDEIDNEDMVLERIIHVKKLGTARFETRHKKKNGELIPVDVNISYADIEGGLLFAVIRDMSEQKRLIDELRKLLSIIQKAQNISKMGSWEYVIATDRLTWSDETYSIFEVNPEEITIKTLEDFLSRVDNDYVKEVNDAYSEHIQTQIPYDIVHKISFSDGHFKWVREVCETDFDSDGNPIVSYGVVQDITERVLAEHTQLEQQVYIDQQNQMMMKQSRLAQMGEMISMIAHQWRQPLGAIAATAANLKFKTELGIYDLNTAEGQQHQYDYYIEKFAEIETFVQTLTQTIDDFRNFYKPDKVAVEVGLKQVCDKALAVVINGFHKNGVVVEYICRDDVVFVMHENEMMQVILNILKNALDNFIEKKITAPKISIIITEQGMTICDNGGGISETIIDRIFDPYFSTKDEKNGTGLGLYMSKLIIEDHHSGSLNVFNSHDGVCFQIRLLKEKS